MDSAAVFVISVLLAWRTSRPHSSKCYLGAPMPQMLALKKASQGKRVFIIDCDLEAPGYHAMAF